MTRHILAMAIIFCAVAQSVRAEPPTAWAYATAPAAENVVLSPDGKAVAMIAWNRGRRAARVWTPDGREAWYSPSRGDQINWLAWKSARQLVMSLRFTQQDADGQPVGATRLVFIDVSDHSSTLLSFKEAMPPPNMRFIARETYKPPAVQDRVISLLPDDPHHILLSAAVTDWTHPEPVLVDLYQGVPEEALRHAGPGVQWLAAPDGQIRLRLTLEAQGGRQSILVWWVRDRLGGGWRELHRGDADRDPRFIPLALSAKSPDLLFVLADQDDGRLALQSYDLATMSFGAVIAADPVCDIEPILRGNQLRGYVNPCVSAHETYLDSDWQRDQTLVSHVLKTEHVALIDRAPDGQIALLRSAMSETAPPDYWYFDQTGGHKTLTRIVDSEQTLPEDGVAPVRRVTLTARDGLTIPALLTLPRGGPSAPRGFVLLPHGGPTAHDDVEFDWLVQFIVSRGYGVMQPQYRGSSGYGAAFQRAGYQQWGGKMQDDVTDATRWLVAQHLADPKRLCIVGVSYGGYAALMGALTQPDLYQCVAAIAPVTDLDRLFKDSGRRDFTDIVRDRIAGDSGPRPEQSPQAQAGAITEPLLLIHGRQDFTVPVAHSQAMERALQAKDRRVTAIYLEQADHYFSRPEDREACLRALEDFLQEALGRGDPLPPS